MLGDAGHSIPSSLFSMVDMCYDSKENTKGILMVDCPSPVVIRPKLAYHAMQNLFSGMPSNVELQAGAGATLQLNAPVPGPAHDPSDDGPPTTAFPFVFHTGEAMLAYWASQHTPVNGDATTTVSASLTTNGTAIKEPALLDLLTGTVYTGPAGGSKFTVPATDSGMLLTEKSMLPLQ